MRLQTSAGMGVVAAEAHVAISTSASDGVERISHRRGFSHLLHICPFPKLNFPILPALTLKPSFSI